jgi:hypothetical protein
MLFSAQIFCKLVVWGNYLIGPHFMNGCLTAAYYRDFLQNYLLLYFDDVPLAT